MIDECDQGGRRAADKGGQSGQIVIARLISAIENAIAVENRLTLLF